MVFKAGDILKFVSHGVNDLTLAVLPHNKALILTSTFPTIKVGRIRPFELDQRWLEDNYIKIGELNKFTKALHDINLE